MRACVAALVLAVIVVAASACSKREKGEPADWTAPPVMEQAEQTRGRQACDAYVERLCACVEARPELADQCTLARSQPEALAQLLGMINGEEGKLGKREMREAQHTARRIIKDCFEKDAALDPASCPR
jgi:thioredoxin-like negative regulator of GroEL